MDLTLVIGKKNYFSWSLQPWLALKQSGIPFREVSISLYTETWGAEIIKYSPSGKVSALIDGKIMVRESMAIGEYLAGKFPHKHLWPTDPAARAETKVIPQFEPHA